MSNSYTRSNTNYNNNNKEKFVRTNHKIRNQYCRIIEEGKQPSIIPTFDAIQYAQSLDQDLIEIGYDKVNNCSICKLGDYSKFMYEQKKKDKQAKKQARANVVELKTVQMSLTIDTADKERMIKHAKEFLAEGNKVKISLRFRNRHESKNMTMAKDLMKEVLSSFDGIAALDADPYISGRELACVIHRV